VTVFGRRGTLEHLEDLIDDRIAACTEATDDLELASRVGVVVAIRGDETDGLALEHDALADEVARLQDILENGGK